jgi:hypothetical protein
MWRSRDIYAEKLMTLFPDDREFARFWVRDLIAPRFFRSGLDEYVRHLARKRYDLCARALDLCRRYSRLTRPPLRRRLRLSLAFAVMAFPRIAAIVYPLLRRDPRFR